MTHHISGQTMAKLTAAATWQREASHQRIMLAWGRALFTEVDRV
jgi:hypothetical protein